MSDLLLSVRRARSEGEHARTPTYDEIGYMAGHIGATHHINSDKMRGEEDMKRTAAAMRGIGQTYDKAAQLAADLEAWHNADGSVGWRLSITAEGKLLEMSGE